MRLAYFSRFFFLLIDPVITSLAIGDDSSKAQPKKSPPPLSLFVGVAGNSEKIRRRLPGMTRFLIWAKGKVG